MSIADSTDLPPQPHTLYTAAELFSAPQRLCCATCQFWKAQPGAVSGLCIDNKHYGAPAFDYDGCAWHSQRDTVPMQSGARG